MPRKSSASFSVVTLAIARPNPPPELTEAEAGMWETVVATKPAEWFTPDMFSVLMDYCRSAMASKVIAGQINALQPEWLADEDGLRRYGMLLAMQRAQAKLTASLATKMRLTQQSKYGHRTADTAARASAVAKPWERARVASK